MSSLIVYSAIAALPNIIAVRYGQTRLSISLWI